MQVLGVGNDLNNPVPDFLADVISRGAHERQDRVDVPLVVGGKLLGQDGNLEHHLFPESVVGHREVPEKFANDHSRVARVAHRVQQVEAAPTDRDVLVAERLHDGPLVLLDRVEVVGASGEVRHRIQAEIANVGLLGKDEPAEEVRSLLDHDRLGVEVNREVDRLEQDGVLRIVLLHVPMLVARVLENALKYVVQNEAKRRVLCAR